MSITVGMSLSHVKTIIARIGEFVKRRQEALWRLLVLSLISWSTYNLGLLHAQRGGNPAQSSAILKVRDSIVSHTPVPGQGSASGTQRPPHDDIRVVASKTSSSKKYHFSWCSSGQRIKEANRIWFPTAQDAQAAGYTLAGNCNP